MSFELTERRKNILRGWGYNDKEIDQIKRAMRVTKYTLEYPSGKEKRITRDAVIKLIGITEYLSGISRSAFHWSAYRTTKNEKYGIYFDSSALFN